MNAQAANTGASASTDCYVTFADDAEPITIDWCETSGVMANDEVEVRPIAINEHFDGIEIWRVDGHEDDSNIDGILAVYHFPITRGDVRKLCWALNVPFAR